MSCCGRNDLGEHEEITKMGIYEEDGYWSAIRFFGSLAFLILFFLVFWVVNVRAETLTASWYSEESLKKEGTWKTSKGVMANGQKFDETKLTCATRLYPLGTQIEITNVVTGRSVVVTCTDRIGKRFAKTRIDLSKAAFQQIASLKQGLIKVEVEHE